MIRRLSRVRFRLSVLRRKARHFFSHSVFVQLWFVPAWLMLGFGKCLVHIISFRRLAPYLGHPVGSAPWIPLLTARQEARALQIGRTVRLAARYTPWDANCLPQAIAARLLLGLFGIPYALYFGLMRDETAELAAHAWVFAGRARVTGGVSFGTFTVVAVYVSSLLVV